MNTSWTRRLVLALAAPVSAFVFAFLLSSIVLILSSYNPIAAYSEMINNAVKLESIIDMLNEATPLYISGVAAAIGFRMNLFNIGVEGQYQLAAFAAAVIGAKVVLPNGLHMLFVMGVAMIVGGLYSGLAGLLKVTRGVNEVISTIMLNSVATLGIIAGLFPRFLEEKADGAVGLGTTPLAETAWIPNLNGVVQIFTRDIVKGRKLTGILVVAIVVGILYHLFINRSRLGFDVRATGMNPLAAKVGGVPSKKMILLAMGLSGVVAGLVGLPDLLSKSHSYDQGFTKLRGFAGIAVALLGRNHPGGMVGAALLFAFLNTSSGVLQISKTASSEIVTIMQGIILLAAVVAYQMVAQVRQREEIKAASEATGANA